MGIDMKTAVIKLAALLAAAALTLAYTSCADTSVKIEDNIKSAESSQAETLPQEAGSARTALKDSLPGDLNFNGRTIRILARSGDRDTSLEFLAAEESGDIVEDAVYRRNLSICERLNVSLEIIEINEERHSGAAANSALSAAVLSGSDDYDLAANHMAQLSPLILQGMFQNMYDLDYIDWDMPWWNASYNDAVTFDNKRYACAGELALTMISGIYATYFNKTLWDENFSGDLYAIVEDGEWTLDKMNEYVSGMYRDINGDQTADAGDIYGTSYILGGIQADALAAGSDIAFTSFDGDRYTWSLENERTADFLSKLEGLLFYGNCAFLHSDVNDFQQIVLEKMRNNTSLFIIHMLSGTEQLRDMSGDYGIIPIPKFNEAQQEYKTTVHNGFSVFVIPATTQSPNEIAAFLEAMCAESYHSVTPSYFEVALKVKYARDEAAARMLDICSEGISFDFAYLYNSAIGSNCAIFRNILKPNEIGRGMSTIASKKNEVDTKLDEILETYRKLT